jgi:hypothetical protein
MRRTYLAEKEMYILLYDPIKGMIINTYISTAIRLLGEYDWGTPG